jgi:rhodanese-related sulfurtransferase
MKKPLLLLVLSLLLATGALLGSSCIGKETQINESITPQEALALIQENQDNPDFVIIDLRMPQQFAYEHIENAINIEYYSRTFQDGLNQLDKNKTYLIYSGSSCGGIGPQSLAIMEELNFREVYNMSGVCLGWKLEGFPTVQENPAQIINEITHQYAFMVYFTGIGCPHCERTASLVLEQLPREYANLVIIEYEIQENEQNAPLLDEYVSAYHIGYELPLIIFSQDQYIGGESPILNNVRGVIEELDSNKCPLADGSSQDFNELDLTSLPGYPVIWHQQKILIKQGPQGDSELLKELLVGDNLPDVLKDAEFEAIEPIEVAIPGGTVKFDNGILIGDWIFQWNGEGLGTPSQPVVPTPPPAPLPPSNVPRPSLTLPKVLTLAVADAVNPCELAILLLMLTTILFYNPGNRRAVLFAGAAFITAVFVIYFLYGLVFIKFFHVVQALAPVRFWLFKGLAVACIVFGVLNIRDFVKYKPGGLGTEMPLLLRPRVKKILSRITSTRGAFIAGAFVTIFLLPCTMGPYIIAAGILSVFDMIQTAPILLLYNLVFIVPMLVIVGIVYFGLGKVHDVYLWKEKNITKLHLIAGSIILGLGIAMLLGLV